MRNKFWELKRPAKKSPARHLSSVNSFGATCIFSKKTKRAVRADTLGATRTYICDGTWKNKDHRQKRHYTFIDTRPVVEVLPGAVLMPTFIAFNPLHTRLKNP